MTMFVTDRLMFTVTSLFMDNYLLKSSLPSRQRKGSILVVEDNDDHWFLTRWALLQTLPGIEAVRTTNAGETLEYLNDCLEADALLPGLILLDLYLPNREDGWHVLETVKLHYILRRLPVVLLSSSEHPDDIEQSYYLRGSSYLVKPSSYPEWITHFEGFRRYWWEAVTLPQRASPR